jgi:hypothetical protein
MTDFRIPDFGDILEIDPLILEYPLIPDMAQIGVFPKRSKMG